MISKFKNLQFLVFALILISVLAGALFVRSSSSAEYRTVVPAATVVESEFGDEKISTPVAKGDTVTVTGYSGNSIFMRYHVVTADGTRGTMIASDLDIPVIPQFGDCKGDTVWIKKAVYTDYKDGRHLTDFEGRMADGTDVKSLVASSFRPALPDWQDYSIESSARMHVISKPTFEKKIQGMTIEEVERRFGPVRCRAVNGKGQTVMSLYTDVLDTADGHMYAPAVVFSPDGTAVGAEFEDIRYRNGYALSFLPLAAEIADMPLTSWLIRSHIYAPERNDVKSSGFDTFMNWVIMIADGIFGLIWIFGGGCLIMYLLWWLLYFPKIFFHVGDRLFCFIVGAVSVVTVYYWYVALVIWGAYALFALLIIPAAIVLYKLTSLHFGGIPHWRCLKCRNIDTMYLDHTEHLSTDVCEENNTESTEVGSRTETEDTWTRTHYSDGTYRDSNRNRRTTTTTDYRDDHYHDRVQYDHYRYYFRCACCGNVETDTDCDRKLLKRRHVGTSHHSSQTEKDERF